jgi:hypothetical protein
MQIGELPGPDGKFPAWEPIDVAMDRLRERYVDHYAEPASWDYSIMARCDRRRPAGREGTARIGTLADLNTSPRMSRIWLSARFSRCGS